MKNHFLTSSQKTCLLLGTVMATLLFTLPYSLTSYATSHTDKPVDSHVDKKVAEHSNDHGDPLSILNSDEHNDEHGETHTDEHGEEGQIEMTAEMMKTVGITTLTASSGEIKQRLTLYGTSTTEPSAISHVRARFAGVITKLSVNVGDKVKKGQLIAEIESNNSLTRYSVYAAISGVITQRNANPGELANEQVLVTIGDHQKLWLELQVFATQQPKVAIGQAVRITREQQFTDSVISQLLPSPKDSPFIIARVPLDNSQGTWSAGSLLSGSVVINKKSVPLIIDNRAVQVMAGKAVIFVKNEHGFAVREVMLGLSDSQFSQVLSGLNQGEVYGVNNSYLLKADLEKSSAEHHH
ncbi:MAG: efflux RND transporter periplasmic adaptor subunit [Colwellia sp.]|uniref:efflux RND transporter periplasmic adaptor subunit n=1 Tax=Colwellia sp. TaxID=56799 RepID=UPI0025BCB184|nr:efflux RND transporter periplasmic adaptor subunit [Colwellia sp.]NQZ25674.1 efflux RND transporter periplasmic adaptor subunit [Colwellia sp.]